MQAASREHSLSRILIQYYNMLCSPPRDGPAVKGPGGGFSPDPCRILDTGFREHILAVTR